jgi:hypothetical protein
MQDSLPAGWLAFAGRELNSLDHYERFLNCYISFPFPGFILTLDGLEHVVSQTRLRHDATLDAAGTAAGAMGTPAAV